MYLTFVKPRVLSLVQRVEVGPGQNTGGDVKDCGFGTGVTREVLSVEVTLG